MDYIPYNSRNALHKSVFGAAATEEKITFKLVMPRSLGVTGVDLVIHEDGENEERYGFFWLSMQGEGEEWWCLDYIPKKSGLFFYHFDYHTYWGTVSVRHGGNGLGRLSGGECDWQLTVYDRNFKTPDWLKGGLIYQIFPDRFFSSGEKKDKVPSDRVLRTDWGGEPYWKPTETGRVLNNDYFGGDLKGIEKKLDYLSSLGVTCIYLNPIFEAQSNHRYDTADYSRIDSILGTQKDFTRLCREAKKRGISVILDGVFSHTGDDSIYFNKYGRYDSVGAYQSRESAYYGWYKFERWPDKYKSWWGIDILPEVTEESPDFIEFIAGENGIAKKWLRCGARGWRLDVADELPDEFLDAFRKAVKDEKSDAVVLGEVWEDASNKSSYGKRRRYLQGKQLDSVMNYPFAEAIISFIRTGKVEGFTDKILSITENYPKCVVDVLMNHIGTHDTMRAITCLAGDSCEYRDRNWQSKTKLTDGQYEKGVKLLKLAAAIQYTLPGVPSLYYGDEAGMQGYKDPFNRVCYPWGKENADLIGWYRLLGSIRKLCKCLKDGGFCTVSEMLGCLAYTRSAKTDEILVIINRNEHGIDYYLPEKWHTASSLLSGEMSGDRIRLGALDAAVLRIEKEKTV